MVISPADVKWAPDAMLPKGAMSALLIGDPSKAGSLVVVRVKLPPNYHIPPHTHGMAETLTILSGKCGLGMGKVADMSGPLSDAGGFYAAPAGEAHYLWTKDEGAEFEVQFTGPGSITYVNPADDPRNQM